MKLTVDDIVPKQELEKYKEDNSITGDVEMQMDDEEFIIQPTEICEIHDSDMMYDRKKQSYYCPLCL